MSLVGHNLFTCVTWLIDSCVCQRWGRAMTPLYVSWFLNMYHDSFVRATWRMSLAGDNVLACVTWLIDSSTFQSWGRTMTPLYVQRDASHSWDIPCLYVWHDSSICQNWGRTMTYISLTCVLSYVRHDSFICATWLMSFVRQNLLARVTWLIDSSICQRWGRAMTPHGTSWHVS